MILPLKLMFSDYVIKSVVSFYCDIIERKLSVVVAHSVEQLLPTPEVHGSNPVIGKFKKK